MPKTCHSPNIYCREDWHKYWNTNGKSSFLLHYWFWMVLFYFLGLSSVHSVSFFFAEWNSFSRKWHLHSCWEAESRNWLPWGYWTMCSLFMHMKTRKVTMKIHENTKCIFVILQVEGYLHINTVTDCPTFFCNAD